MWREVSYDNQTWDMVKNDGGLGTKPSSQYPWSSTRRLDAVRIGADGKPDKMVDMKFGNDPMKADAKADYERIARKHTGDPDNFEEFRVDGNEGRCTCDDGDPPQHGVPVEAPEKDKSLIDQYGEALESATGLKVTGGALVAVLIVSQLTRLIPARNAVPMP
jgi:hypothetical protein